MKFRSFTIKNFKGIRETTLDLGDGTASIHTLVGLNESGKTTVLEAINMFQPDEEGMHAIAQQSMIALSKDQLIPKTMKADFTGEIRVEAKAAISSNDIDAMSDLCAEKFDLEIDRSQIPDEILIVMELVYDNSKFIRQNSLWSFWPHLKTKRQKKFTKYSAPSEEWQAIISLLRKRLPRIIYFPNFLFEFPEKILISGALTDASETATKTNEYFVGIIEDAMASLDPPMELGKHVVDRIKGTKADHPFAQFIPFWYGSPESESVDDVLERLARKITDEVFGRWQAILGKEIGNAEIEVASSIEANPASDEREVYLTFRVKQGRPRYRISERSLGFRWFFCFLLFTRFSRGAIEDQSVVFLFDEPASNLHSKAQAKLLDSFEVISGNKNSIIFSTHSHHLVNPLWLEKAHVVSSGLDPENELDGKFSEAGAEINITVTPYRRFVGENDEKSHYFQPILDRLQYSPSAIEAKDTGVLLEGKSDFYILSWYKMHHCEQLDLNFLPVNGVTNAAAVLSLMLGWGKDFVFLFDSDSEGKTAMRRYQDELPISAQHFVEYEQVFGSGKKNPRQIEGLLSDADKGKIAQHFGAKRTSKSHIQKYFSAALSGVDSIELDAESLENLEKLTKYLKEARSS